MAVTITRFGGVMAMKPKTRTFELSDLEGDAEAALRHLMDAPPSEPTGQTPDAFTYQFEIEGAGSTPVSLSGALVPDPLRKFLP